MRWTEAIKTITVLLLGAVAGKIMDMLVGGVVISSIVYQFALLVLLTTFLILLAIKIVRQIESLQQRIGIKVLYVDRDTGGDRTIVFQRAKQVVEQARESILILNSFLEESHLTSEEGRPYYETLIRKAREGLEYKRIVQVRKGRSVREMLQHDVAYLRHFHEMLEAQESDPRIKIELRHTEARYLTTFVLVDDTKLLWQVSELDETAGIRMRGIFIFDDPRREITRHFRDFFDQMARRARPVTRDDLPPLPRP